MNDAGAAGGGRGLDGARGGLRDSGRVHHAPRPVGGVGRRECGECAGVRARRDGDCWVALDGTPLAQATGAVEGEVLLGIRPEHIALDGGDAPGRVRVVENTGPSRIVVVDWAGAQLHVLTSVHDSRAVGDEVRPAFDAKRVVVWPSG